MSDIIRCPHAGCGAPLPAGPGGTGSPDCPVCGRDRRSAGTLVLPTSETAKQAEETPIDVPPGTGHGPALQPEPVSSPETRTASVGRYQLKDRLGSGTFGDVYRAHDPHMGRTVALKIAKPEALATDARKKRFLREARNAADLRHPNIVPVFDSGVDAGRYYIATAFIAGGTLAARVAAAPGQRLPPAEASAVVRKLAQALAYAHGKGVIHRDVKPANILLDERGEPLLADFGLAARDDGEEKLTQDGAMMGTPAYMAPEHAAGLAIPASDQYSLGCTLYELLTGDTPFSGPPELQLFLHQSHEPPSVRAVVPSIPPDIAAVTAKCLEKNAGRRYPTCDALAEDLRRYEAGEPTLARPLSPIGRAVRWARREPRLAAALATVIVASLIGFYQRNAAVTAESLALERSKDLEASEQHLTRQLYDNSIALAEREIGQNQDLQNASRLLEGPGCPPHLRGWEWRYLMRQLDGRTPPLEGHTHGLWGAVFSPDGSTVATCSIDGTVKLWDPVTGRCRKTIDADYLPGVSDVLKSMGQPRIPVLCLEYSPDGRLLATGSFRPRVNLGGVLPGFGARGAPAIDRNSPTLIRFWDAATGDKVAEFDDQPGVVLSLTFSPDGKRLAVSTIDDDYSVVILDVATCKKLKRITGLRSHIHTLRFHPSRPILAGSDTLGTITLWNSDTYAVVGTMHGDAAPVTGLAFSPGPGNHLASCGQDGFVRVWDTETHEPVLKMTGHMGAVLDVRYSPDSGRIISGGFDKTVRLWDAATGEEKLTLRGHKDLVWQVSVSPDGEKLVSASFDHTARVWDASPPVKPSRPGEFGLTGHTDRVNTLALSRENRLLVSGGWDKTVRLWDAADGTQLRTLTGHEGPVWGAAINRAGDKIASAGWDRKCIIWDRATGAALHVLEGHTAPVQGVAFSPDGLYVASCGYDARIFLWDVKTGAVAKRLEGFLFPVLTVAFSPDGRYLASGGSDRTVKLWRVADGTLVQTLKGHDASVAWVEFSPDGSKLASASWDTTARLWDTTSIPGAKFLRAFVGHEDRVNNLSFSPDGRFLATASQDKTARVWDTRTGKPAGPPRYFRGILWAVVFDRGGNRLIAGSWSNQAWIQAWAIP